MAANEARTLEGQNHLMDGRRSDAERRWWQLRRAASGSRGVGIGEGEILPLGGREAGFVFARHLIHLSIRLRLETGGGYECTLV